MNITIKAFIQNEAGLKIKNRHNEKTLEYLGSIELIAPYPFPYGFILETTTEDGDNVDCYILTREKLKLGSIIECQPIGLLEVFENGELDHKAITVLPGEQNISIDIAMKSIRVFIGYLSKQFPSTNFRVGDYLPVEAAIDYIKRSSNPTPAPTDAKHQ
ncbi:MAG: inorganic diphosphatase [Candidatus Marinimicrobia bacterium]|nr:inorganic diphosphatase [Candidatus Neomarinimicrobiota bacterium]